MKRKIWIAKERYANGMCDLYWDEEPHWDGEWWMQKKQFCGMDCCKAQLEKFFGVKVPPYPELLELEIEVKEVCSWVPEEAKK